jgi:retron-type reverse transcriptase
MKFYENIFDQVACPENLFLAWDEFKIGKLKKKDVLAFESRLEENIFDLHRDLKYHKYKHAVYYSFYISDPKQRRIHKATVRDRVLHHAIFRILNPLFEPTFIADSFSCRVGKGNHKGNERLACLIREVSRNYTSSCFVLKCDIKKFFDSIDHQILLGIIKRKIKDPDLHWLIEEIVSSFGVSTEPNIQQLDLFGAPTHTHREREREREREQTACGR